MRKQLIIFLSIFSVLCSCGQNIKQSFPLFPCSKNLDNPYGVVSHFDTPKRDYSNQVGQLDLMSDCNIRNVRMPMPMDFMGDYITAKSNFYIDTALNRNQKYKVEELIVTKAGTYSSGWAWDNIEAYTKALDYYLDRYGSQVKSWEIINEINLKKNIDKDSLPYKYMSVLPLTYNIIKKHNKNNLVVLSGIGGKTLDIKNDFCRKLYNLDAYKYFDVFNFHVYGKPEKVIHALYSFESLMKEYGDIKPVWITECGMTTYSKKTGKTERKLEVEQSKRLARFFLISFAYGVDKVFWYELRSNPKVKGAEREFGVVSADLKPKPGYYAYKTLTKMCPNHSSRPKLYIKGDLYLAEWNKPDKSKVWAVWSTTSIPQEHNIEIQGNARYYNHLGHEINTPIKIKDGVTYIVNAKSVRIK